LDSGISADLHDFLDVDVWNYRIAWASSGATTKFDTGDDDASDAEHFRCLYDLGSLVLVFTSGGLDSERSRHPSRHEAESNKGESMMPNKSLEPTAAPLSSLARLSFRAAGSSGCGSALIR
jgi:hypothetical protein